MNLCAFTLSFWNDKDHAEYKRFELERWYRHVNKIADCNSFVIGCGTYSDPAFCPIDAHVVNAEVELTEPYNCETMTYSCCAEEAALWHVILNTKCDAVLHLCSDGFLRNCVKDDIHKLFESNKMILAYNWADVIDDAFYVLKRNGIVRYLNRRLRPNLSDKTQMIMEREKAIIFNGLWMNPFPAKHHYRYPGLEPPPSYETVLNEWPICIRPPCDLVDKYAGHLM